MRRTLAIGLVLASAAAVALFVVGPFSGSGKNKYWVELDNAFGLINGGDLKIAGVRAGRITDIKLDRRTLHARVGFVITRGGFGSLRPDAHCESRPQSLIGEYFLDCDPGTDPHVLKPGSVIPVAQTASTVAPDLVNDIMRQPYRERLSLIISSLGAGVAGNADSLNAAIRRAVPALRETDNTLAILGTQTRTLQGLTQDADRVVGDLAANRADVGRWVQKANDTAVASAERRTDIAAGLHRLPGFLAELQPTMKALGDVADQQTPALQNLRASSRDLTRFFGLLGPFADASRPAVRALGQASVTGDDALRASVPTVQELNRFSAGTPGLGGNLAIVLRHLDDRRYAIEDDPRSPGGKGYTGLEALLQYVYDQTLSTNVYDQNSHILKLALIAGGDCTKYADVARAKQYGAECSSTLGPNQPGINFPDATAYQDTGGNARARGAQRRINGDRSTPEPNMPVPQQLLPQGPAAPQAPSLPALPDRPNPSVQQPQGPPVQLPGVPPVQLPPVSTPPPQRSNDSAPLLNYLLK